MEWEAKNHVHGDQYQYCCYCNQKGPSTVSTIPHYRIGNQLGIHSSSCNRRIGNETSVLDMVTTLPANGTGLKTYFYTPGCISTNFLGTTFVFGSFERFLTTEYPPSPPFFCALHAYIAYRLNNSVSPLVIQTLGL